MRMANMGEFGELVEIDVAMYQAVLNAPGRTLAVIAESLGSTPDELDKSVARLSEMGLLRQGPEETFTAVSPMLAEATVLGAEDLELGARRAALEQRRDAIRRLVPAWNSALSAGTGEAAVDVVAEPAEIMNALMHYVDTCQQEILSVAPGRLPTARIDGRTRLANVYAARRGIKTRALYQHSGLRDRATRAYLKDLASLGARIRLTSSLPGRSLVYDRRVALLPVPTPVPTDDPGRYGLAIVHDANVVAWVVATFEQMWAEAEPLEDLIDNPHRDDTELDQTRAMILRLMADGEKDEAISRRLSISVRTCRRHIADYMTQVGATSRFQAGVIAARAGHIDLPWAR
jgi:DNA-binding CsgD family transcriptional regulator